jgi:NADPH2:quinone reductase
VKAIRVHACGGPEAMVLEDLPLPSPGPDQVLVEVKAAGVNLFDTQLRSGLYKRDLPLTLGLEGAGIVEAIGPEVTDVAVGDRVAFISPPALTRRTPWRRPGASCHCPTASGSKTPRR